MLLKKRSDDFNSFFVKWVFDNSSSVGYFYFMKHLSEKEIEQLKTKLETEKTDVENQIQKLMKGLDFGNDIDSLEEEADEAEEMANRLGVKRTFEDKLININEALAKIKTGQYGICEKCGGPINLKVLEIMPESKLCQNCKRG